MNRAQSHIKDQIIFNRNILLYWVIGSILFSFLIILKNYTYRESLQLYHFSFIPSLFLILFLLSLERFYKFKPHKKTIIIITFGTFNALITSKVFLGELYGVVFGGLVILSLVPSVFIYFDKFQGMKEEVNSLRNFISNPKTQSIDNKEELLTNLKTLHDDIKYWLDKGINGIFWVTVGFSTSISILWGFASNKGDLVGFQRISVILITIYIYIIIGIFLWIIIPLMRELKKSRESFIK